MAVAKTKELERRINFAKFPEIIGIPNLIEIQRGSFQQFLQLDVSPERREEIGLQGVFTSIFPISDYEDSASLEFVKYDFGEPKYTPEECREKGMTYSVPLKVTLRLVVWEKSGDGARGIRDVKEQEVYLGEMPVMSEHGTFIINGTERVVVSQLHRSPGAFFDHDRGKTHVGGKILYHARLIPNRGSWLEFEFDAHDILHVRVDRRRKFLVTILLRAIGYGSNEEILSRFYERDKVRIDGSRDVVLEGVSPGWRTAKDLADPKGKNVILQRGKMITGAALKKLQSARVKEVPIYREDLIGRILAMDVIDRQTGEVLAECAQQVTEEVLGRFLERKVRQLHLIRGTDEREVFEIRETILRDPTPSEESALVEIYRRMRPGDPPTLESAQTLLRNMFFNPRRYDLSKVGRFKLNSKLEMNTSLEVRTLQKEDIVAVIRYLLNLKHGEGQVDDIDHLGNRRVRSAGELLEDQFRIGLARMERAVRE
ncbi:MAG: DNA-directed RNA polymerase subunit beta, partial [Candidatus Methylomirabilales bacterium]